MLTKTNHSVNLHSPSIIIALILISYIHVYSQWEPDLRLTINPAESYTSNNNSRCIGVSGDSIYIVWEDTRNGNYEIYYKRSIDGGTTWDHDIRISNNLGISALPVIAVSGPVIHIAWYDNSLGNNEIFYIRSTNGGYSWQSIIRLTDNPADSKLPAILVSGSIVHVMWEENRDGNQEIYYKRSTNEGVSWGIDKRLTNSAGTSESPSVAFADPYIYLVWHDNRAGNPEIYFKLSINGGNIWGPDIRLTNNSGDSFNPCISANGTTIHVAWHENRDTDQEIYYKRSTTNGDSWGPDVRLTNSIGVSYNPVILVSYNAVHITWVDDRDANEQIFYNISTDGGITFGCDLKLTNQINPDAYFPSLAVSGRAVHLVWCDQRDGNWEIYYKRNLTGNPIGLQNISSEIPEDFSLKQNYPNPFNPSTEIEFAVPNTSNIRMAVYDLNGREVGIIVNQELKAGIYKVSFDGSGLSSGVYFYRLITKGYTFTKKMLMVK